MGATAKAILMDVDAARKAAGLKPLPTTQEEPQDQTPVEIDRSGFMDPDVRRGIPCFDGNKGLPGGGAIKGTKPGDPAHELDRDARDLNEHARRLVQQRMREAREQLRKPRT